MKFLTNTFILLASLIIASTANASNTIHTLKVRNTGTRVVSAFAQIAIGFLNGTTCTSVRMLPAVSYTMNPNTSVSYTIDGDDLATNYGLGYTCMAISFQTDKQNYQDQFILFENDKTYTSTQPLSTNLTVD